MGDQTNKTSADIMRESFYADLEHHGATTDSVAKILGQHLKSKKKSHQKWAVEILIQIYGLKAPDRKEISTPEGSPAAHLYAYIVANNKPLVKQP